MIIFIVAVVIVRSLFACICSSSSTIFPSPFKNDDEFSMLLKKTQILSGAIKIGSKFGHGRVPSLVDPLSVHIKPLVAIVVRSWTANAAVCHY